MKRRGRAVVLEVALGGHEYEWGRWEGLGDLGDDGVLDLAETLKVHRRVTHNQKVRLRNGPDSLRFHWKTETIKSAKLSRRFIFYGQEFCI